MKQTIALVDDDRNILTSVSMTLEQEGYTVRTYTDGESALQGITARPVEGTLLALGTVLGGWSFHMLDGRLRYVSNYVGRNQYVVESPTIVPPGGHELSMRFDARPDYSGTVHLFVDDVEVGTGEVARTTPVRHSISGAGMTCGWEQGPPIGPGYTAPFRFTGTVNDVTVAVLDPTPPPRDLETEYNALMAEQ